MSILIFKFLIIYSLNILAIARVTRPTITAEALSPFCQVLISYEQAYETTDAAVLGKTNGEQALRLCSQQKKGDPSYINVLCQELWKVGEEKCKRILNFDVTEFPAEVKNDHCVAYQRVLKDVPEENFPVLTLPDGNKTTSLVLDYMKFPRALPGEMKGTECSLLCSPQNVRPICDLAVLLYATPEREDTPGNAGPSELKSADKNTDAEKSGSSVAKSDQSLSSMTAENSETKQLDKPSETTKSSALLPEPANPTTKKDANLHSDAPGSKKSGNSQAEMPPTDTDSSVPKLEPDFAPPSNPKTPAKPTIIDQKKLTDNENARAPENPSKNQQIPSASNTNDKSQKPSLSNTKPEKPSNPNALEQNVPVPKSETAKLNAGDDPKNPKPEDKKVITQSAESTVTKTQTAESTITKTQTETSKKEVPAKTAAAENPSITNKDDTSEKVDEKPDYAEPKPDTDDTSLPVPSVNSGEDVGNPEVPSGNLDGGKAPSVEGNIIQSDDRTQADDSTNGKPVNTGIFPEQEDSHFFAYFLTVIIIIILAYLVVHNKQKILGLIVEGRGSQRRRSHSYRKLETEGTKGSQMIF